MALSITVADFDETLDQADLEKKIARTLAYLRVAAPCVMEQTDADKNLVLKELVVLGITAVMDKNYGAVSRKIGPFEIKSRYEAGRGFNPLFPTDILIYLRELCSGSSSNFKVLSVNSTRERGQIWLDADDFFHPDGTFGSPDAYSLWSQT